MRDTSSWLDEAYETPWLSRNHPLRAELAERQDCRCWYCGRAVSVFADQWERHFSGNWYVPVCGRLKPVLEHVVPRKRGGKNKKDNIVLACWGCNSRKSHRNLTEFREWWSRKMGGCSVIFWGERLARRNSGEFQ